MRELLSQDDLVPLPFEKEAVIIFAGVKGFLDDLILFCIKTFKKDLKHIIVLYTAGDLHFFFLNFTTIRIARTVNHIKMFCAWQVFTARITHIKEISS
ncbi:TPA: hypothetical protein HA253_02925 [Candidatus Woesearchaeota archaeon]|nr:hypothetical protein [Candidatus Woesearchaeota archaeon]